MSWQITPDTRITVEADIQRNRIIFDRGVIAINKQLGFLPISRFLGEPGQSTYQSQNILQARIDHRFNADWQMRLATHFATGTLDGESARSALSPPTTGRWPETGTCAIIAGTSRSGRRT